MFPFPHDNGHANLLCVKVKTGEVVSWVHEDGRREHEGSRTRPSRLAESRVDSDVA
ncbi:hypothetical protein MFU01_23270 [Myxococcus fulvus]|uniref:Uncharacterized protein n=1 Tax=Myxococcus fulvus TaxID=33 RepID=A0A511SZF7_MYXFU|nr:hypothetical protein MFU01_23270 [Myxococcus fulvus]